jgi:hypothetical protein
MPRDGFAKTLVQKPSNPPKKDLTEDWEQVGNEGKYSTCYSVAKLGAARQGNVV